MCDNVWAKALRSFIVFWLNFSIFGCGKIINSAPSPDGNICNLCAITGIRLLRYGCLAMIRLAAVYYLMSKDLLNRLESYIVLTPRFLLIWPSELGFRKAAKSPCPSTAALSSYGYLSCTRS